MSGYSAARAEMNGALIIVTRTSRPTRTAIGVPGSAIKPTSSALLRSQTIITRRRGHRSARPARVKPPTKAGTTLAANVIAASRLDRVCSNTSRVSATRASWSPATDSTWASQSARNSAIPKTSANVARRAAGAVSAAPRSRPA